MFQEGAGASHTHFTVNNSTFLYNYCGNYNRISLNCEFRKYQS